MSPRVSVVMPVYNAAPYLSAAIEGVLNQTFRDFELIMVNDCSTDNSLEIMQAYAAKDPRIIVLSNEKNLKNVLSRNRGMSVARGEYIAVHDADDLSFPERLQRQVQYLDSHPEVGVLATGGCRVDQDGAFVQRWTRFSGCDVIEARLSMANHIIHSSVMMRRHLVEQVGGYSDDFQAEDDYELWSRLMPITRVANLPDILVLYRQYQAPHRVTARSRAVKEADIEISFRIMKGLVGEHALDEEAYKRLCRGVGSHRDYQIDLNDVNRLQPLWNFLAAHPNYRREWGSRLVIMLLNLIKRKQLKSIREVSALLWVILFRLGMIYPSSVYYILRYWWDVRRSRIKPLHIVFPPEQQGA